MITTKFVVFQQSVFFKIMFIKTETFKIAQSIFLSMVLTIINAGVANAHETEGRSPAAVTTKPVLSLDSVPKKQGDLPVKNTSDNGISSDPGMEKMITQAKQDLVSKFKASLKEIEVIQASYVTWRDSSIGCPEAGMNYLQVLKNGAQIILRVGKKTYHYHSGGNRPLFHCQSPSKIKPMPYEFGEM